MKTLVLAFIIITSDVYAGATAYWQKDHLSLKDIKVLEKAYQESASHYNLYNKKCLKNSLPIITTNPHHRSVAYWLKAQLKNSNLSGLPILHLDSHTDMGFSPSHYKVGKNYFAVKNILKELSLKNIEGFNESLTDISQVLLPAMATKLSNRFFMCMPPWYSRTPTTNEVIHFNLFQFNQANFVKSKTHRYLPVVNIPNTFTSTPFIHSDKYDSDNKGEMIFFNCFTEEVPKFKGDFILSLDLDILSTNGVQGSHARPISHYREKGEAIGPLEFSEFKFRLKKIMELLLKLKERGSLPRIITIADSTKIAGGGYTPTALAYLANDYLRRKLNKLY